MLAVLTKAIRNMVIFLLVAVLLLLGARHFYVVWKERQGWAQTGGFDPKTLPTPKPALRIGLIGRPVELPVKALSRLPEASRIHMEFRTIKDPDERFEMLAAGTIDLTLASLDELALALPRFQPGFIVFPAAENRGGDGVVESDKGDAASQLMGFLPGGTSEALARAVPGRQFQLVGPDSPERTAEWLKSGQLRAASLWQPYLADAQKAGAKLLLDTRQRPTTEVWVASRHLLHSDLNGRATVGDLHTFAKAWFLFIDQLNTDPELTLKAMASENDLTPERAQASLQGLTFLTLSALKAKSDRWPGEVTRKLESELTFWSLSGAPNQKGAKFDEAVDPSILSDLLAGTGEGDSVPPPSPAPDVPSPSPIPSATPSAADEDISMLGGDAGRRGISPGPALLEVNQPAWTVATGGEINTATVGAPGAGLVLFGCDDKTLYAVDEKTGGVRWRFAATDQIRSTPAVSADRVFVGCNDARLYAVDLKSGTKLWAYQAQGEVIASPCVQEGRVYCASQDGTVFCLDAEKGDEIWKFTCPANVTSSPAISNGVLVIGCYDGGVYGLSAETGEKAWVHKGKGAVQATPCISDGKVFIGSLDHNFYALKLSTGQEIWKKATGDEIALGAAADEGTVCFGGRDTYIYALDTETGKERWKYPTRERLSSSPTICQGVVYIGSEDKRIYVINVDKGTLRFHHKVEGWVSTPLVLHRSLFFGCTDKSFYCLR